MFEVRRYKGLWAVYEGATPVVVAVYRSGAQNVARRLAELATATGAT